MNNNNPFKSYSAGAFRAAIASCFISGRISEQQIDFIKETLLRPGETEIDQSAFPETEKEEMKSQWKLWLYFMTHGILHELRASFWGEWDNRAWNVYFNSEENVDSK